MPIDSVTTKNRLIATESRNMTCGRFEFPCHSGECIAVYNACNGIPQCVDGSDEGPECSASTIKANEHHLQSLKPDIVEQVPTYRHNLQNFQHSVIDAPFNEHRDPLVSAPTAWANKKVQNDMQSDIDRTTFGRKNQIKVPAKNVLTMEEPIEKTFPIQREMYPSLPGIRSSFPTPQIAQPTAHVFVPNVRWPSQRQQWQLDNQGQGLAYSTHDQLTNIQQEQDRMKQIDEQITNPAIQANENALSKAKPQESVITQEKNNVVYKDYSGKPEDNLKKPPIATKSETSNPQSTIKETPHASVVEQYKMIEQHLEIKFTDHDGYSERPRGAVLSLTLGLLVTGIIVVLIGCRLRTIGGRGGRLGGKASYAPEEDFLVNGMYL